MCGTGLAVILNGKKLVNKLVKDTPHPSNVSYSLVMQGTLLLVGSGMPPSDSAVRTFAILYVLGNIITLCATGFLLTPQSQWSKMWDETRRYTTAFYLTMLVVVFALAITVSKWYMTESFSCCGYKVAV